MLNLYKKLLGEVPMTYNGGGKSGGGQTAAPSPIMTTTAVGSALEGPPVTFEESDKKVIDKKKLGTRGLQIPLAADKTTTGTTVASGGIQI